MGIILDTLKHLALGRARRSGNLAIVPVVASLDRPPRYRPLATALRAGACRIEPLGPGGQAAALRIANDTETPLLIVDGEELVAGRQHRVANLSVVLGPYAELTLPTCRLGREARLPDEIPREPQLLPAFSRMSKLSDVSCSLQHEGLREANQAELGMRLGGRNRAGGSAAAAGLADLYTRHRQTIAAHLVACAPRPRQVGAVFCLNGRIAGLELFDSGANFRHYARASIASQVIELLEGTTRVESLPEQRTLAEFFVRICEAAESRYEALGEGEDLRFGDEQFIGAGLAVGGRLVHLLAGRRPIEQCYDDPRIVPFRWRARPARLRFAG